MPADDPRLDPDLPAVAERREPTGWSSRADFPDASGWICNCLIRYRERVLLLQRAPGSAMGGRWDLPGGKVDPGEEPVVAALRELTEETGLTGKNPREIDHWSNTDFKDPTRRFHTITFAVEIAQEPGPTPPAVVIDEGHVDYIWASPADISRLPLSHHVSRVLESRSR